MAGNYGAKVGQTIAGRLARGKGGKFSSSGSGGQASAPQTVTTADLTAAAGMTAGELEALRNLASGKPLSDSQVATLEAAGLAQRNSDGQLVRTSAARSLMVAIRKGDVQAIKEALSNGKDRAARKAAKGAKAPKGKKPTSEERQAARKQAQNDSLASALEAIGNDDSEVQAEFVSFARGEGELSELNAKMLAGQGLVEANADGSGYRLTKEGRTFVTSAFRGDKRAAADAAERASEIAAKKARNLETKEDARRWVVRSASNYRDVNGEHVSLVALEGAAGIGEGPLLWWHEYEPEPVVLGWCDFGAMHEGVLIESGTFVSKEAADFVEQHADLLGASIGFWNDERDKSNGVYQGRIVIAERSLLPRGLQANGLADYVLVTKGDDDMKAHKKAALIKLAGAENTERVLALTDERIKAAKHIGLTAMEAEAGGAEIQTTGDAPAADAAAITPSSEAIAEPVVAEAAVTTDQVAAAVVETGQQGGEDVKAEELSTSFLLGDMTPAEFTQMLGATFAQALAAIVPQLASAQLTTKASDDIVALTKKVDDLTKRLEDEAPSAGYRPAGDPDQIVRKQAGAGPVVPQPDAALSAALELVERLNGQPGQQA